MAPFCPWLAFLYVSAKRERESPVLLGSRFSIAVLLFRKIKAEKPFFRGSRPLFSVCGFFMKSLEAPKIAASGRSAFFAHCKTTPGKPGFAGVSVLFAVFCPFYIGAGKIPFHCSFTVLFSAFWPFFIEGGKIPPEHCPASGKVKNTLRIIKGYALRFGSTTPVKEYPGGGQCSFLSCFWYKNF